MIVKYKAYCSSSINERKSLFLRNVSMVFRMESRALVSKVLAYSYSCKNMSLNSLR